MNEYLLLIPICFGYIAYKCRNNIMATLLLSFYAICSFFGYLLTQNDFFPYSNNYGHQAVSMEAVVYLIVCCCILFYPVLNNKRDLFTNKKNINISHYYIISSVFIVFSILYIIATIPFISLSMNALDFSDYKEDVMFNGLDLGQGNVFLNRLFSLNTSLRPFISFFFVYSLTTIKRHTLLKSLLGFVAIGTPIAHTLAAAHRHFLVYSCLEFLVCYLMFYKHLSTRVRKVFTILFLGILSIVIVVVVVFAIWRWNDFGATYIQYSLARYIGESFVNFNTMLWGTEDFMYGNKSFPLIREWLGITTVDPAVMREHYADVSYINYYFYSIIGHFYMDVGPVYTVFILLLISIIFNWLINKKMAQPSFSRQLLLFLYTSYTLRNYFYFEFIAYGNKRFIWMCVIYWIVCVSVDKEYKLQNVKK